MFKILIGVVVVTIAVIGAFLLIDPNVTNSAAGSVTEVANTFTVAVEGEVYKTGNYTMKDGATDWMKTSLPDFWNSMNRHCNKS